MKQVMLFLFASVFMAKALYAQERHKMKVQPIATRILDRTILYNDVLSTPGYDYHVVCIYTNYCIGTKYLFQRIKYFDSLGYDQLHWVFCSSADLRDSLETIQLMKRNHVYVDTLYMINNVGYKEKKSDDRYKGFVFRKDICTPCKKDIIGVPYTIVYNSQKEIVAYGYIHETEILKVIDSPPKRKPQN
jgi:hypothetical protein